MAFGGRCDGVQVKGVVKMIYLDNAATSYPKAVAVRRAVSEAMVRYGANPGRGGYPMAMATSEMVERCRKTAADFFGVDDERRVIFTPSCTQSLNTVLKSLLAGGGRVAISDMEHNAVVRPLHAISPRYPVYDTVAVTPADDEATVAAFRRAVTSRTKAIVCTHASNVTGEVLPIARLAALAHEYGLPIVVDAAQSAGHVPIDVKADGIDYLCAAGHKGLGGLMGTGLLVCNGEAELRPLAEGGTGSHSLSPLQPLELPERLESGTLNVTGIAGLSAGIQTLMTEGVARIEQHEFRLCRMLYEALSAIDGVTVYGESPILRRHVGVLSFTVDGMTCDDIAQRLANAGVAVRAGLHCAPLTHRRLGTLPHGTIRLSVGRYTTWQDVQKSVRIIKKIVANPLQFNAII